MKFREMITESWYSKYLKKDNQYMLVMNFYYSDYEEDVHALGEYELYGIKGAIKLSGDLEIDFDRQGSAYALFSEDRINLVIERHLEYNEVKDMYMDLDKLRYITKPKKSAKDNMLVEVVITMKESD